LNPTETQESRIFTFNSFKNVRRKLIFLNGAVVSFANHPEMGFVVEYISFPKDRFHSSEDIYRWCVGELRNIGEKAEYKIWNSKMRAQLVAISKILEKTQI
jgi:hypothetical protein